MESHLLQGMACCHSLTLIGGEVRGDPLDCRMFQATKWVCLCIRHASPCLHVAIMQTQRSFTIAQ